ncbi:hypothetical protein [Geminocystis herdmanii]|uniref:hypothetical protein n=1 Tax=Geminocystis herdmanii TaxID=669359 RepID=UPI00034BB524|nr:hypothetical protein [Geminocystis herdmanii]
MAQKNNSPSTPLIYYVSPSGKIHERSCRHCQPDKEGWQKLDSFLQGFTEGYQPCRLCCPSEAEIKILQEKSSISIVDKEDSVTPQELPSIEETTIPISQESSNIEETTISQTEETQTIPVKEVTDSEETSPKVKDKESVKEEVKKKKSVKESKSEKTQDSTSNDVKNDKSESKKDAKTKKQPSENKQEKVEKVEKKRYKILAGNGCHQAIAELQGILVPPHNEEAPFLLILPDGFQMEATFKNPRLKWLAHNTDAVVGSHWFRVYPKMKDDKLISVQIIAWDKGMPSNPRGEETWEFIGVWTAQRNVTVQRSMTMDDIRKIAKETGFIKKFKYTFINSFDFVKQKKLWMGYVYKLICKRKGDVLEIKKVIPYACPRIKPEPKNFIKDNNRDNNYNKGDKKDFKPKTFKPKVKE